MSVTNKTVDNLFMYLHLISEVIEICLLEQPHKKKEEYMPFAFYGEMVEEAI